MFAARVVTDGGDHHVFLFTHKPDRKQVIDEIMCTEGASEDERDFYTEATSVWIYYVEPIEN